MKIFFLLAYLIFWALIALTGFVMSLDVSQFVQDAMVIICSWTPTYVILIMFKKLYPDLSFKQYLKLQFTKKDESTALPYVTIIDGGHCGCSRAGILFDK